MSFELVAVLFAALGLICTFVGWTQVQRRERNKRFDRIEHRITRIEVQIKPFWGDLAFAAAQAATRVLREVKSVTGLDSYIDAFLDEKLDRKALGDLMALLQRVRVEETSATKRDAAVVLLREIKRRYDIQVETLEGEETEHAP